VSACVQSVEHSRTMVKPGSAKRGNFGKRDPKFR
jgi:hypothetical protein